MTIKTSPSSKSYRDGWVKIFKKKRKWTKLPPLPNTFASRSKGCLNCGLVPLKLSMRHRLSQDFGGEHVTKDGKIVYWGERCDGSDEGYRKCRTMMFIELKARKRPNHDWRMVNDMPLHSEEYQRQGKNLWVLVKKGLGFA